MALSWARPHEANSAQMKEQRPQLPDDLTEVLWGDHGLQ
jgi:hypothetical protein